MKRRNNFEVKLSKNNVTSIKEYVNLLQWKELFSIILQCGTLTINMLMTNLHEEFIKQDIFCGAFSYNILLIRFSLLCLLNMPQKSVFPPIQIDCHFN